MKKKVMVSFMLAAVLCTGNMLPVQAAEDLPVTSGEFGYELQGDLNDEESPVRLKGWSALEQEIAQNGETPNVEPLLQKSLFTQSGETENAKVTSIQVSDIPANINSKYQSADWSYHASVPQLRTFFDYKGNLNVAFWTDGGVGVLRYNSEMEYQDIILLKSRLSKFGNVTCDDQGNYYVIWGQDDLEKSNGVVTSAAKYSYDGTFLAECTMTGFECIPYFSNDVTGDYWGTQYPFYAGTCSVTVAGGKLACSYGRRMYSGHQSNYVFYVDCDSMQRIPGDSSFYMVPYCSHSFDQRILSTSDGGYLVANQGDAYDRGFLITKVAANKKILGSLIPLHFREGCDRSYGYNETYAQMGSLLETSDAYVFCGSSEKTLSLDVAPTNSDYCGHSEARNLFVTFLKKDFYAYSGADAYQVSGEVRKAVGTKPDTYKGNLWLKGNEVDYGVIWLTDYDADHYVNNPQMLQDEDGNLVILWEKLAYSNHKGETYYAIISPNGKVIRQPVLIADCYLAGNTEAVYRDGKIYFATKDLNGSFIRVVEVKETSGSPSEEDKKAEEEKKKQEEEEKKRQEEEQKKKEFEGVFDDIFEKDWWYDAVWFVYDHKLMNGTGKSFEPTNTLTREQFAMVLFNHSNVDQEVLGDNPFPDVKNETWYHDAVVWAYNEGIVAGKKNRFGVGENITRQELATILYRYAGKKGLDLTAGKGAIDSYPDRDQVESWAADALNWAVSQGIISGKGPANDKSKWKLDPKGEATRAECAMILKRLLEKNES